LTCGISGRRRLLSGAEEAAVDQDPVWRKSSFCEARDCVEVATLSDGRRLVRNSADPAGPVVGFSQSEWSAFVAGVGNGEFSSS
jgi:hypothetical protein